MVKVEGTRVYGRAREEGSPFIDPQVSSDFLDLLISVRKTNMEYARNSYFQSTPELEERIDTLLNNVSEQVPGINRHSLDRIIRFDPWNYQDWVRSVRHKDRNRWAFAFDFPQVAANWDNPMNADMRAIAVEEYGVGDKELDFLQSVFEQIPPVHFIGGAGLRLVPSNR